MEKTQKPQIKKNNKKVNETKYFTRPFMQFKDQLNELKKKIKN